MARNQSIRRKKEQRGVWFADVTTTNYLPVIFPPKRLPPALTTS
jgi:hypothetical protein